VDHRFQIDLRGLLDLLSNHLYSGPEVFVRELLQNATDAIRARGLAEHGHEGEVTLEVHAGRGKPATLIVTDNGIGLTADEVHKFLATIGQSSKRGRPTDFIGQFGIGILACFVVSEEIVVVTRSVHGGPALEWRAKPDGTYTLKELTADLPAGTQVALTAKPEHADLFTADRIRELARSFGGLLPYPVKVAAGRHATVVNEGGAPWRQEFVSPADRTRSLLAYGKEVFGIDFWDAVPLRSKAGDVDGVAFIVPHRVTPGGRKAHRVYLKNMFLADTADNLLPEWAFFVRCVINANTLRPTASRESFYEDKALRDARDSLGECLREYLVGLSKRDPHRLAQFLRMHHLAIKALAVDDEEFFTLIADWLPFETSLGEMTLGEYRKRFDVIRFAPTVDAFRQIAPVAAAQDQCVINGGYVHDADLLRQATTLDDALTVEEVDPAAIAEGFEDATEAEHAAAAGLLQDADAALAAFDCAAELRRFRPAEVSAMYVSTEEGRFLRNVQQTKEVADPLWGGVLDGLRKAADPRATLCLNARNPLVQRLTDMDDSKARRRVVGLLYVQALMMAHHPLQGRELRSFSDNLAALIDWGMR
jgi:molecular chaperone HtpG